MPITDINFDAAGLLSDVIPDKQWHYCSVCWRPIVFPIDIEQHPQTKNLLETLGCTSFDHRQHTPNYPLYIEVELMSYVFPYPDEIRRVVSTINPADFKTIMQTKPVQWEYIRDVLVPRNYTYIWTGKTVAIANQGNIDCYPRHPMLGMSYLD